MEKKEFQIDSLRIKRLQNGDVDTFRYVFDLYSKDLLGFLFKLLKSKEDAEEALQETYVKLWENRASLRQDTSLKSYLFTIAVNFGRMTLRTRKYHSSYLHYLKNNAPSAYELEPEKREIKVLYDNAVSQLPPERKKIYLMCRHENLSHKEIATLLEISPKTVENQMSKAIKFLQNRLKNHKDIAIVIAIWMSKSW